MAITPINAYVAEKIVNGVVQDGGASVNIFGDTPIAGYMVAIEGPTTRIYPFKDFLEAPMTIVLNWMGSDEVQDAVANDLTFYGAWHNRLDGTVYLDVSEMFFAQETALNVARARNQQAIYDVARGQDIQVV